MKLAILSLFLFAFVLVINSEENNGTDKTLDLVGDREGNYGERAALFKHLMGNYDKNIYPDSPDVYFGLALMDTKIDEDRSTLESNVWIRYNWYDSRLKWDATEYPIDVLRVDPKNLWIPDISLYNSADLAHVHEACWFSNILIYPDGKVLWVPPCHFSSYCKTTLKQHPYNEQTCFLKFGSWTYSSNVIDLSLLKNETTVDMDDFWDVSDWKVVSTIAQKNVRRYACCKESYTDLTFNITLRRKPDSDAQCSL